MHYLLRQTWRNMRESWGLVLQTLLMMSISLLILGAFGGLALQVEEVLHHWEKEAPLIIYLRQNISPAAQAKLKTYVDQLADIERTRLIKPKEAMHRLRRSIGKKKGLLKDLDATLFPPTLEVTLRQRARTAASLKSLGQRLQKLDGVEQVDYGSEWIAPLWRVVRWMRAILWVGGALLLLCSSLMAAGTIRLTFFMHQDEIEIMRLVGATEGFIRGPFYLEGALEGALAASLALASLFGLFLFLDARYGAQFVSFTMQPLRFFTMLQMGLFVLGGICAGLVGSWLALLASKVASGEGVF